MPSCRLSSAFGALSALPVLKSVIRVPPPASGPMRSITPTIVVPSKWNSNRSLVAERGLLAVLEPPVPEHPLVDELAVCRRHGLRGELASRQRGRPRRGSRPASCRACPLDVLDHAVHELADPRLVAGDAAEPELVAEHVLQLAVVQVRHARVGEPERLAQRPAGVGPGALVPPASRGRRPARAAPRARRAGARPRRRGRRAGGARTRRPRARSPDRRRCPRAPGSR